VSKSFLFLHVCVVKQWTETTMSTMKPSRSDEISDPEQQIKNANQIRADFDSLAPKRPTKPTRSEPGFPGSFSASDKITDHPEADKFQSLQSQTHVRLSLKLALFSSHKPTSFVKFEILVFQGKVLGEGDSSAVQDEFLETEYYSNLTAIDKQHHTVPIPSLSHSCL